MSDFPGFILTKRGQALLAKLQAGGQLTFTRAGTGSGRMPPANSVFSAVAAASTVTITNSEPGASGAADVNTGFVVQIATPGSAGVHQVATVQCLAADQLSGGDYFTLSSPYLLFHVWFAIDGVGADPAPAGSVGIKVNLAASNTAIAVAATLATTLDSHRLDLADLCCLITEQQTLAVQSITRPDPAVSEIAVILTNAGLVAGYDLCELGVFATDPDLGEILYAVTNAGDHGDYFPAEGGATLIEAELRLRTIIAAAAELSMEIMAEAYAGLAQFVSHLAENATESAPGHAQLATAAETLAGLLTNKAVHPAGVKAVIDALLDGTPGALDTLNELAAALGDDANYAATITTALAGKAPTAGSDSQVFRVATAAGDSDAVPLLQIQSLLSGVNDPYGFYKLESGSPAFTKTAASTLSIKAGTKIMVAGVAVNIAVATAVVMCALTAGTDYAIYACTDGTVRADASFTAPTGYTTANSRIVGGFHYGLVAPGTTVAGGSFATTGNGMIWTQADVDEIAGINAFSLWDLKWRPLCDPKGMALVAGRTWVDIYFCGTNHTTNGTSKAGTDIASGTVLPKKPLEFGGNGTVTYATPKWWDFVEIAAAYKKRLIREQEFVLAAFGVTENQSIGSTSATYPTTQRNAGYTSKYGLEQASGHHWTWGDDSSAYQDVTGAPSYKDINGGRGQVCTFGTYGLVRVILGGYRSDGVYSGSRCSDWILPVVRVLAHWPPCRL